MEMLQLMKSITKGFVANSIYRYGNAAIDDDEVDNRRALWQTAACHSAKW